MGESQLAATWSETGRVHIWDLTERLYNIEKQSSATDLAISSQPSLFTFSGHQTEGYAIDWSSTCPGALCLSKLKL